MSKDKFAGKTRNITNEELDLWIACPKEIDNDDFDVWVKKEKKWLKNFEIPLENLFVYEINGKFWGKICILIEEKNLGFWVYPDIKDCKETPVIAKSLYKKAIDVTIKRNLERIETYLDKSHNQFDILDKTLRDVGFTETEQVILYGRELDKPPEKKNPENLEFIRGNIFGEIKIKDLFLKSRFESLDHAGNPFPPNIYEDYESIKGESYSNFIVALKDKEPVGFSSLNISKDDSGSLLYICVLPEYRGQKFGDVIFNESLNSLRKKGSRKYLGSTNAKNLPMINIFKRNGCKKKFHRIIYIYFEK